MTHDPNQLYGENYYKYYCGSGGYERAPNWLNFFGQIADRIIADFSPKSVLDAGCAIGMLVEALRDRGVDAQGFDISEFAISQMPAKYRPYVKVGSILDQNVVQRRFDLVVCIEVLEHLQPHEAEQAIQNLCAWGDVVLFTSSPEDYKEVTHFNVQQPGYWVEKFALQGFSRMLSYDASYIAPWAMVFRRERLVLPSLVRQYENRMWEQSKEIAALRQLVNEQQSDVTKYRSELDHRSSRRVGTEEIHHRSGSNVMKKASSIPRRFFELSRTARTIYREQGAVAFANRTIRWLKGERRFHNPKARVHATQRAAADDSDSSLRYLQWIRKNEPGTAELEAQKKLAAEFPYQPLISILTPVYNTDPQMLIAMIESVLAQTYSDWEFCLVDGASTHADVWETLQTYAARDSRIKIERLDENFGISGNSNAALKLVTGEFTALLDHDDVLAPFALFEVVKLLNEQPEVDFIYSDKDTLLTDGTRYLPLFKPGWSPEILLNANYLTHLCVLRTSLMREIGGFDPETDGAQDWMLFLKVAQKTDRFAHIPKMLYHWREHSRSTASGMQAKPYAATGQLRSIQAHLDALGLHAQARFEEGIIARVVWNIDPALKVSIILNLENEINASEMSALLNAYRADAPDCAVEWIILNHSGNQLDIGMTLTGVPEIDPQIITLSREDTQASALNHAAALASGDVLIFISSRLKPEQLGSLSELVGWTSHQDIGVVGGQLLQPNLTIAHTGYILNLGGLVGSLGVGQPRYSGTLLGHLVWYRNFSAVSGHGMAIRRELFESVGGFDEAFEQRGHDIDLCLRLMDRGKRHVYTPFAVFKYAEFIPKLWSSDDVDGARLRTQHAKRFESLDPYYSPNLALDDVVPQFLLR